ncbi:MAG: F0F1 ATP synthase subunit B [Ruminobacter sp.]|nr:F0F1 ATP synthase subunit B [Ruminobacter sp.]
MSFNMTFLVQIIAFTLFVLICMKWIWPPIINALNERQKNVLDSYEKIKEADQKLELANNEAAQIKNEALVKAQETISSALKQKSIIMEQATEEAKSTKQKIIDSAKAEIESEKIKAKEALKKDIASLVLLTSEKFISNNVNTQKNKNLVDEMLDDMK